MNKIYLILGVVSLVVSTFVFTTGMHMSEPAVETQAAETQTVPPDTLRRPLRFLMVGLGQDMSRISDGIWHEDYEMIRLGAQGIASHPRVTPQEMMAIKTALGEQFPAFVGYDKTVHQTATQLSGAAQELNMEDILQLQSQLVQGCVSCHSTFRDDVRNALY